MKVVEAAINKSAFEITSIITCGLFGADQLAGEWAKKNDLPLHIHKIDWNGSDIEKAQLKKGRGGKLYDENAKNRRDTLICNEADALILIWEGSGEQEKALLLKAEQFNLKVYLHQINLEELRLASQRKSSSKAAKLAKKLNDSKALILDTESSGGSKNDEIIEIAIVEAGTGTVLFDSLIKPSADVKLNWYAAQVHGITESRLKNQKPLSEHWDEIYNLLKNKDVVAYNVASDKRMIAQTAAKLGLKMPKIRWHCLMKTFTQFSQNNKNVKLSEACQSLHVKGGNHRAVEDALAAARVLYRIAKSAEIKPKSNEKSTKKEKKA